MFDWTGAEKIGNRGVPYYVMITVTGSVNKTMKFNIYFSDDATKDLGLKTGERYMIGQDTQGLKIAIKTGEKGLKMAKASDYSSNRIAVGIDKMKFKPIDKSTMILKDEVILEDGMIVIDVKKRLILKD